MTPIINTESGPASPVMGIDAAIDRDGVAVLDVDGVCLFTGTYFDAVRYMDDHDLQPHCNAEVIENRGYLIGFEPF